MPVGCHGLLLTTQLLMRAEDCVPEKELTGAVYQAPYAHWPATYVGQTGQHLNQQLGEHRRAAESGETATPALAEHAWGDNIKVLDQQPHLHQRLILGVYSH